MRTIMVVDDEMRQVKALSAVIRRLRPAYRILEATDVKTSWELLERESVDAVLTDIRMPDGDGLTLVERINHQKPHVRTVLISGYGQFDYAQQAISHRVIEYLIKPIGLADIERVIVKLDHLFVQDNEQRELNKELIWHDAVTNTLSEQQRRLIHSLSPSDGPGLAIVFEMSGEAATNRMASFKERWKTVSDSLGHCETFQEGAANRLVTLVWLSHALAAKPSEMVTKISRLLDQVRTDGFEVSVGVSRVNSVFRQVIKEAYDEALLALQHRFYAADETVFWGSDIRLFIEKVTPRSKEILEPLVSAIKAGERHQVLKLVNDFFKPRDMPPFPDPGLIRDEVSHMVWELLHNGCHCCDYPLQRI